MRHEAKKAPHCSDATQESNPLYVSCVLNWITAKCTSSLIHVFLSRINSVVMQLTVKWAFAVATLSLDSCFISGQDWPEIMSICCEKLAVFHSMKYRPVTTVSLKLFVTWSYFLLRECQEPFSFAHKKKRVTIGQPPNSLCRVQLDKQNNFQK